MEHPIYFVDLITICFPHPNESFLWSVSLKLPLQPLNNFPTSGYYHYRTRTLVGFSLFLKNTGWLMWNSRKQISLPALLQATHGGILYECVCMHVCSFIPLKTGKFQWRSKFFSHSWFTCLSETHGHTNTHIYLYIVTCISIFMYRHVFFNIVTKNFNCKCIRLKLQITAILVKWLKKPKMWSWKELPDVSNYVGMPFSTFLYSQKIV